MVPMSTIHDTKNFDLNLIRVFLAVAQFRSVTAAGEYLGVTQSSVSHALARLRTLCDDPLFINSGQGMLPTAVATNMLEPLTEALDIATRSFCSLDAFDPGTADRNFCLILSEIGELSYLPLLLKRFNKLAPNITLRILHLAMGDHYEALIKGYADLTIGTFAAEKTGFHTRHLFNQPYVCMLSSEHPKIRDRLSVDQYFEALHISVEPPGRGPGIIDLRLKAMGRARKVALRLPHFLAVPIILRQTDYIVTVPARTWRVLGSPSHIRCLPLPFDADLISARLVWHERSNADSGHTWLRENAYSVLTDPVFFNN